jgi:hypothetical protein
MNVNGDLQRVIAQILDEPALLEIARKAVEDELIDFRDLGMWVGIHNNGFACKDADGTPSAVIRFGTIFGLQTALRAISDATPEQIADMRKKFEETP